MTPVGGRTGRHRMKSAVAGQGPPYGVVAASRASKLPA